MKLKIWDILSILVLVCALIMAIVILTIFANPNSSVNPFPPPTSVPTIFIPTPTPTEVRFPPTWTPVPVIQSTIRPTSTPFPTKTPLRIP
jgi:hypothetical protein